ncbi:hypothetical protein M3685_12760 [Heyndrickxia oleronia]|uniref:hypothetical protein n=1 Tax=Heyndrickxia oleronia TaxID=38875 RepID=UPI0020413AE6|nr:hypothetical protein [Heyndrickxia oleronia]MCM3454793.1 hypothetical protein [Heyndrickxia oleronia]
MQTLVNEKVKTSDEIILMNPKDMTMEDAVNFANKIAFIESGLKKMKDHLKLFVELNGPVEAGGVVWDKHPSNSWKFTSQSKKEFAEMIAIEGMNPWEYLSFSASDLKKLGWDDAVLSQYAESKTTHSFRSKKVESK